MRRLNRLLTVTVVGLALLVALNARAEEAVRVALYDRVLPSTPQIAHLDYQIALAEAPDWLLEFDGVSFYTSDVPSTSCDTLRECGAGCDEVCKAKGTTGKKADVVLKGEQCNCTCEDGSGVAIYCFSKPAAKPLTIIDDPDPVGVGQQPGPSEPCVKGETCQR